MFSGIDIALSEITLVMFTTLAPAGVIAFILMGLPVVWSAQSVETTRRISQWLSVPLITSMVGLVASATHLGNPANALYVFLGVGRSPLSTEVFCAVVFLLFAGLYWLYSFVQNPKQALQRVWLALAMVAGVAFVFAVAFAYSAETIVSWNTVYVPLGIWCNALVGGPILAIVGLRAARYVPVEARLGRLLVVISFTARVLNVVVFALQGMGLPEIENSFLSAADLVPLHGAMTAGFCILAAAGIGVDAWSLFGQSRSRVKGVSVKRAIVASVLVFAGIFIMRFAFYMMHMTSGLGV